MKYLLVLFLVSTSLQPLALQACAMDADPEIQHHEMMHDQAMDNHADMDCCDTADEEPSSNCNETSYCGAMAGSAIAIPGAATELLFSNAHQYKTMGNEQYSGPPSHPLFRPPIA